MATTPRLGLSLPVGSDIADIKLAMNPQLDKIDSVFDALECSSAARPAVPFDGQIIWETDTQYLRTWVASLAAWHTLARYQRPYGKMGLLQSQAAGVTVAKNTEQGPFFAVTVPTKYHRRYAMRYSMSLEITDANSNVGDNQIRIRYAPGAAVAVTDTLHWWTWADLPVAQNQDWPIQGSTTYYEGAANPPLQITFGLFISRGNSNGTIRPAASSNNVFMVEDTGSI